MKSSQSKLITVRLSMKANRIVREFTKYRGDFRAAILFAVTHVDLHAVEVVPFPTGRRSAAERAPVTHYFETSVTLPVAQADSMLKIAQRRKVSRNALVNAAILAANWEFRDPLV